MASATTPAPRTIVLTGTIQAAVGLLMWLGGPSAAIAGVPAGRLIAVVFWTCSAAFLLSATFAPALAVRLFRAWTASAHTIGVAITTVLFAALFVLQLPFALVARRNDPLRRRLGGVTYWEPAARHDTSLDRALQQY